jgi:hypothetical protein
VRRRRRALIRTLILATLAGVVGCRGCDRGHAYPPEVVDNFIAACRASASESSCRCTIDHLRRLYTYEEFQVVEQRLEARDVPPEMSEVLAACSGR